MPSSQLPRYAPMIIGSTNSNASVPMNTDCASSVGRSFSARCMRFTCFSTARRNCSSFILSSSVGEECSGISTENAVSVGANLFARSMSYVRINSHLRTHQLSFSGSYSGSASPHLPQAPEHLLFQAVQAFPDDPQLFLFLEQLFQQPLADALVVRIVQETPRADIQRVTRKIKNAARKSKVAPAVVLQPVARQAVGQRGHHARMARADAEAAGLVLADETGDVLDALVLRRTLQVHDKCFHEGASCPESVIAPRM